MKILAIETSADETGVAIIDASHSTTKFHFDVLGSAVQSQIDMHREYGGIFPTVAKREHARNLVPLLTKALEDAQMYNQVATSLSPETRESVAAIFERNEELGQNFISFIESIDVGAISVDAIAITHGPGLPPALWIGVMFANALSRVLDVPLIPVNHMEGHIYIGLASPSDDKTFEIDRNVFPLLSLLISGGHTELVLSREPLQYEKLGQTLDDAVGEAFDKTARMLGLPYPGGPEISKLAEEVRNGTIIAEPVALPRPMMHDNTCNFSFSGIKTAVMYALKKIPEITDDTRRAFAYEFETAVAEVLYKKTAKALEESNPRAFVIGGGVAANTHIRRVFAEDLQSEFPDVALYLPEKALTGDNALMIAFAAYARTVHSPNPYSTSVTANGNLSIAS